jgi:CMP-N,N'-diacetyllegionaminic acid synthase
LKKNVLIIGYGSIGQRHYKILKKLNFFKEIFVLSKRKIDTINKKNLIKNIKDVKYKNIGYVIIASRTEDHKFYIKEIERNFKNLIVIVEKPLLEKFKNIIAKKNQYHVGYNLRFHPIIQYLKEYLRKKKIYFVEIKCTSFLPKWRKNINYIKSNSSGIGGGALLELSHEIDYAQYIFGQILKINFNSVTKISNLKIKKDDNVIVFGKSQKSNFSIYLNIFSHYLERKIIIYTKNLTILSDLINNKILFYKNHKIIKKKIFNVEYNDTYTKQYKNIFLRKKISNFKKDLKFMKLIDNLRNNEKKNK